MKVVLFSAICGLIAICCAEAQLQSTQTKIVLAHIAKKVNRKVTISPREKIAKKMKVGSDYAKKTVAEAASTRIGRRMEEAASTRIGRRMEEHSTTPSSDCQDDPEIDLCDDEEPVSSGCEDDPEVDLCDEEVVTPGKGGCEDDPEVDLCDDDEHEQVEAGTSCEDDPEVDLCDGEEEKPPPGGACEDDPEVDLCDEDEEEEKPPLGGACEDDPEVDLCDEDEEAVIPTLQSQSKWRACDGYATNVKYITGTGVSYTPNWAAAKEESALLDAGKMSDADLQAACDALVGVGQVGEIYVMDAANCDGATDCLRMAIYPESEAGLLVGTVSDPEQKWVCGSGSMPPPQPPCPTPPPAAAAKILIGMDDNYPPYAERDENGELSGFGVDIAKGMNAMCADLEIEAVHTLWDDCWSSAGGGSLGAAIENGTVHACATYTHTRGVRDELADFSYAILKLNKAAGLLTLLDENGQPKVDGQSDLSGVTIVDVGGWAPTADTIPMVENKCTGSLYSGDYTLVVEDGNDAAMKLLRSGGADAMFVYADQAYRLSSECDAGTNVSWDCNLWKGFGTEYAYVQTGQFGYAINGTTLALTKKGSGVAEKLNPCLQAFMESKEYYDACEKYDLVDSCYRNEFFPAVTTTPKPYDQPTNEHTTGCDDGYCACTGEAPTLAPTPPTPAPTDSTPEPTPTPTAPTPEPTPRPTQPPASVKTSVKMNNIDPDKFLADTAVQEALSDKLATEFAKSLTGVDKEDVFITYTAGSVIANIEIIPKADSNVEIDAVLTEVTQLAEDNTLTDTVREQVASLEGIDTFKADPDVAITTEVKEMPAAETPFPTASPTPKPTPPPTPPPTEAPAPTPAPDTPTPATPTTAPATPTTAPATPTTAPDDEQEQDVSGAIGKSMVTCLVVAFLMLIHRT